MFLFRMPGRFSPQCLFNSGGKFAMASEKLNKTTPQPLMAQIARYCLLAGMSPSDGAGELRTEMIELKLRDNHGNQVRTAQDLQMHRNTLRRDIQESARLQLVLREIRESLAGSRFARRAARKPPVARIDQSRLDDSRVA
jgi:hypothetical protein